MNVWRNLGRSRHPATEHDPQREPEQGGTVDREEPIRHGESQYLDPDPARFSPHRPVGSPRRLPRAQAHHKAPEGDTNAHRMRTTNHQTVNPTPTAIEIISTRNTAAHHG